MSIQHVLVVVLVALAVPLQAARAACQCFQETATSPEFGYLELFPVPCTSTPPNHGWLKVPPDGNGNPSPPMYVALRSSRNLSGMVLLYSGEWSPGVPRVALTACMCCGCSNQPPPLSFDFQPPDSVRTLPHCASTVQSVTGSYTSKDSCEDAQDVATQRATQKAATYCSATQVCSGTYTPSSCRATRSTYDKTIWYFRVDVNYAFSCYATGNLCQ
jgi:hypothetical protein